MNVFCMAKAGSKSAYVFWGDRYYRFSICGDEMPKKIDDLIGVKLYATMVDSVPAHKFENHLNKVGFVKQNLKIGNGSFSCVKHGDYFSLNFIDGEFFSNVKPCVSVSASTGEYYSHPIPVEDVPIGSRITGIENADGEIDAFSFPVQRVEVSDGFITFMHYWPTKQRTYSYEISIKRGTRVTYTAG